MPPKQQQANGKPKQAQQGQRKQSQTQGQGKDQQQDQQQQDGSSKPAFSEEEQNQEKSKAAQQSLEAKKKARYYMRAAAGAGDSKERQRLLKEALNKEVESESFGKLAKWLNSGALQGFAAGSIPAASLGALTGTLVGGVTSLITGGLGAGIGYLKGPAYTVGGVAASGAQKVFGDMAEWNPDATPEQQQAVEHMCGQIQDEDMPDDDELEMFSAGEWSAGDGVKQGLNEFHDGRGKTTQSWSSYAASWVPGQQAMESVPGYGKMKGSAGDQKGLQQQKGGQPKSEAAAKTKAQGKRGQSEGQNEKELARGKQVDSAAKGLQQRNAQAQKQGGQDAQGKAPGKAGSTAPKTSAQDANGAKKGPGSTAQSTTSAAPRPKGKPRKLEKRS